MGKIQDVMILIFRETKQNLGKLTGVACLQPSSISFLFVLCFLIHKKHKETQFSSILTKDTFIFCICPLVLTTLKVINYVMKFCILSYILLYMIITIIILKSISDFIPQTVFVFCFSHTLVLGKSIFLLDPSHHAWQILVALDDTFLQRFILSSGRHRVRGEHHCSLFRNFADLWPGCRFYKVQSTLCSHLLW